MKAYIIIAHTGQEIIDSTPEARERVAAMKYLEERQKREHRIKIDEEKRKRARNPLYRIASFCGII